MRRAWRALLVVALLVLQHGTLTHPLSHAKEPVHHSGVVQCDLCHALASADAAIPAPPPLALIDAPEPPFRVQPEVRALRAERFVAFASRAPPRAH